MKFKNLFPQKFRNLYHLLNSQYYSIYFGAPSKKLKVIGVTGTDGKTTTSTMLYEILRNSKKKTGLITTISAKIGNNEYPIGFHVTTPDPKLMQKFLKDMIDADLEYAVVETTSHGLDQHRVGGIQYAAAVYTNITHEHLDYHKTFENYRAAKMKLIDQTSRKGFAVINMNDASAPILITAAEKKNLEIIVYGIAEKNQKPYSSQYTNLTASNVKTKGETIAFTATYKDVLLNEVYTEPFVINLPGEYNVSNALAAISAALMLGLTLKQCAAALSSMKPLAGRWEIMQEKPFKVVVDFAHTPNGLENVLQIARNKVSSKNKLIVVFGCAGLRDASKRPLMGGIAGRGADITILTAEDPRTEKVADINAQIISGIKKIKGKKENVDYFNIEDRTAAIKKAITLAKPGDLVLITGKGHETSMNLDGKKEIPWSDQKVVLEILNIKESSPG